MKNFLAVFLLVSMLAAFKAEGDYEIPEEIKKELDQANAECIKVSGVTQEQLDKEKAKKVDEELDEDPKMKEHRLCISKKMGFMDESGEIKIDVLKAKLNVILKDAEKTEKIVTKCAVKKDTPLETANELKKCMRANCPVKKSDLS